MSQTHCQCHNGLLNITIATVTLTLTMYVLVCILYTDMLTLTATHWCIFLNALTHCHCHLHVRLWSWLTHCHWHNGLCLYCTPTCWHWHKVTNLLVRMHKWTDTLPLTHVCYTLTLTDTLPLSLIYNLYINAIDVMIGHWHTDSAICKDVSDRNKLSVT